MASNTPKLPIGPARPRTRQPTIGGVRLIYATRQRYLSAFFAKETDALQFGQVQNVEGDIPQFWLIAIRPNNGQFRDIQSTEGNARLYTQSVEWRVNYATYQRRDALERLSSWDDLVVVVQDGNGEWWLFGEETPVTLRFTMDSGTLGDASGSRYEVTCSTRSRFPSRSLTADFVHTYICNQVFVNTSGLTVGTLSELDIQFANTADEQEASCNTNSATDCTGGGGGGGGDCCQWIVGAGVPSNFIGSDNDLYLDTDTGDIYQKQSGAWVLVGNIEGPAGPAGSLDARTYPLWLTDADNAYSGTNNDFNDFNGNSGIIGTGGGTLVDADNEALFQVLRPYGIVIGDSIAKGTTNIGVSSRLQNAAAVLTYDPTHNDKPGQPAYQLANRLGLPMLNQAIGSQTSTQVWARWNRDVLGQTVAVGDGLPNTTIDWGATQANLRGKLPVIVYVHVGINDIFAGTPVATIQANLELMAQSAQTNKFKLLMANIGPHFSATTTQEANMKAVNAWLKDYLEPTYSEWVQVIDYAGWATLFVDNPDLRQKGQTPAFPLANGSFPAFFADAVHPNEAGYAAYADYIAGECRFKTRIASYAFDMYASLGGAPDYSYIDVADFGGLSLVRDTVNNGRFLYGEPDGVPQPSQPVLELKPLAYTLVQGTGAAAGFSGGWATIDARIWKSQETDEVDQLGQYVNSGEGTTTALVTSLTSGFLQSHNRIMGQPVRVHQTARYENITIDVNVGVAGQSMEWAFCEVSPATGKPFKILATGTVDLAVAAIKTLTLNLDLSSKKLYAFVHTATAGASTVQIRILGAAARWALAANPSSYTAPYTCWDATYAAGLIPNPLPTFSYSGLNQYVLHLNRL